MRLLLILAPNTPSVWCLFLPPSFLPRSMTQTSVTHVGFGSLLFVSHLSAGNLPERTIYCFSAPTGEAAYMLYLSRCNYVR